MLRSLMDKKENKREQTGNVDREMEMLRQNKN